MGKLIVCIR